MVLGKRYAKYAHADAVKTMHYGLISHQVVLGFGHIRIIWAKPRLVDLQSPAVVVFHLLIFALILAEQGQVVQLFGYIWMIFSKNLVEIGIK